MLPETQPRKKRNSSKVNLMISFVFHALIVVVALYFAARQGFLGKQLKKISVEMVKEKMPEKPKEPEKIEPPKIVDAPKPESSKPVAEAKTTPLPVAAAPTVAPPAAELPAFEFEGGRAVETSADPVQLYRGYVEYALRSKWQRPGDIADDNYVVEVAVTVDTKGRISDPVWQKKSGDTRWDDSVRQALAVVTELDRRPPTNFPPRIMVRFDVQEETEPVLQ